MARFTDPIAFATGSSGEDTWTVEGGTLQDPQPTFNGAPLFDGHWTRIDSLIHFSIVVDMSNILTFGTGQYYMVLPYPSLHNIILSDGCLRDASTGEQYSVLGSIDAGSTIMKLYTVGSNGRQVPFEDDVPVKLAPADTFHIAGVYDLQH